MASLELDPASGRYRVRFRYGDREYKRSLRTKSRPVAHAALGQVEEALRMLAIGLVELPSDVDEGTFIVSGLGSVNLGRGPHYRRCAMVGQQPADYQRTRGTL